MSYIENFCSRKMKKVSKPLNGSTNRQWKNLHSHFRNVKTIGAQSEILQTQSTQNQKSLHRNLKIKFSKQKRHLLGILTTSCQSRLQKEQKSHHRQIVTHDLLYQFCENPKIITQNWPHRDAKWTKIYKAQENLNLTEGNMHLHVRPQALEIAASSFKSVQICSKFQKIDRTRRLYGFRSTRYENFRPKKVTTRPTRHQKVWWSPVSFHVLTRADYLSHVSMMPHVLTCALSMMMSLWFDPFAQVDPVWPVHPDPIRTIWKKKKKGLTKLNFDFDQKVKIPKMGLSHLVFRVHSNFGIRFFIRDLEIMQTVQFPESWLLHKS